MDLDARICERARLSRDPRFDGRYFIGVLTTGVYCRPICPVQPPKAENVRFFPSAAAAADAGFRPCLRCRPESSPGTSAWLGTSGTVSRGLRLVAEGALDRGSVADLARHLGIGPRHLHRLFMKHLGASPVAVAQTRRLHFAKKLIDETHLKMAEVAFSAGFGSIRRFNAVFRETYGRSPVALRRARSRDEGAIDAGSTLLRLAFRPPFDWERLIRFLAPRAIPGVEVVDAHAYRRTIHLDKHNGTLEVRPAPGKNHLEVRIQFPDSKALLVIVERVRRIFDLAADPTEISRHLARDPHLAPLVERFPGLRVPGAWDGFELAVRAILGQQVTVKGATTLAGRLVQSLGEPLNGSKLGGPTTLFPTAEALAEADARELGLPEARARAIRHLAEAVCQGEISFDASISPATLVGHLTRLPGIGDWTAQYVSMRALGDPDAFPASDLGLLRAASNGESLTPRALLQRAEAWRPWRAYAAMYLWSRPAPPAGTNRRKRT